MFKRPLLEKGLYVSQLPACLLITGLLLAPVITAAHADELGVITMAEKPLRLIRGTAVYSAIPGTQLHNNDLIESGQSITQIEGLIPGHVALGPNARVAINRSATEITLHLLLGWLKWQPAPSASGQSLHIATGNLNLESSQAASVVSAHDNTVEVFVENGTLRLEELDKRGQAGRQLTLTKEQYSQRMGNEPLSSAGRPPATFIAAMPDSFFDPLLSKPGKTLANVPPAKIRDVEFEDISPWLHAPGPDGASLAKRFSSRLASPVFRKAIIREMGGVLEWETELYRFESRARTQRGSGKSLFPDLSQSRAGR